jgi:hypothetical protein
MGVYVFLIDEFIVIFFNELFDEFPTPIEFELMYILYLFDVSVNGKFEPDAELIVSVSNFAFDAPELNCISQYGYEFEFP